MGTAITAVWTEIMTWLTNNFSNITSLFITESSGTYTLTFVGYLGVIMAGISLVLLIFNLIRSFLVARG